MLLPVISRRVLFLLIPGRPACRLRCSKTTTRGQGKKSVPRTLGRRLSGSARERAGRPERRHEQHEDSHVPISTTAATRPGQTRAAAAPCGGWATQTGLVGACDTAHRCREAGRVRRDGSWARALVWAAKACFHFSLPRRPVRRCLRQGMLEVSWKGPSRAAANLHLAARQAASPR